MNQSGRSIQLGFAVLVALPLLAGVRQVLAVPAVFDWGSTGTTGFGVLDTNNATILQTGDLAQFIWAGPDGVVAPPACDGTPSGDDVMLDKSIVNNGPPLPPPLQNKGLVSLSTYTFDTQDPQAGGIVFIRAWNDVLPTAATAYGDSTTSTLVSGGSFNAPTWSTNQAAHTSWVGSAGGDWHVANNWNVGIVPGPGTDTVVPSGSSILLTTDAAVGCLTVASGSLVDLTTFELTAEESITNDGTLRQTKGVSATSAEFLHITDASQATTKYRGIDVDTTDMLGDVTVSIRAIDTGAGEFCTNTGNGSPAYAERCFQIASTGTGGGTVTLWALLSELHGIAQADLAVFRHDTGWQELMPSTNGSDGGGYAFAQAGTTGFSDFLLGEMNSTPTAVLLSDTTIRSRPIGTLVILTVLILLTAVTTVTARRQWA